MSRRFFVLHRWGAEESSGETAAEAERKVRAPGGMKNTLAIIDAAYVGNANRPRWPLDGTHVAPSDPALPFIALIEAPLQGRFTRRAGAVHHR